MQLQSQLSSMLFDAGRGRNSVFPPQALPPADCPGQRGSAAYLLMEVVIAVAVLGMLFVMIVSSYYQTGIQSEWTGYSLAAQSLTLQQIEQARSAPWDPANVSTNGGNSITNLTLSHLTYNSATSTWTGYTNNTLDVPIIGTNVIIATNYVSIQYLYVNNDSTVNAHVYLVRVDTVWPFFCRGHNLYFTNTTATLLAPDNQVPPGMAPTGE